MIAFYPNQGPPCNMDPQPPVKKFNKYLPITEQRKKVFLHELAKHGILARAAIAASPHTVAGNPAGWINLRKRDPEFDAACFLAIEQANARIEEELCRRAVDGYTETVTIERTDKEGNVTTETREVNKYSDQLLLALMKARNPAYRDHSRTEHVGVVGVADLSKLSPESRDNFRKILQAEMEKQESDE